MIIAANQPIDKRQKANEAKQTKRKAVESLPEKLA